MKKYFVIIMIIVFLLIPNNILAEVQYKDTLYNVEFTNEPANTGLNLIMYYEDSKYKLTSYEESTFKAYLGGVRIDNSGAYCVTPDAEYGIKYTCYKMQNTGINGKIIYILQAGYTQVMKERLLRITQAGSFSCSGFNSICKNIEHSMIMVKGMKNAGAPAKAFDLLYDASTYSSSETGLQNILNIWKTTFNTYESIKSRTASNYKGNAYYCKANNNLVGYQQFYFLCTNSLCKIYSGSSDDEDDDEDVIEENPECEDYDDSQDDYDQEIQKELHNCCTDSITHSYISEGNVLELFSNVEGYSTNYRLKSGVKEEYGVAEFEKDETGYLNQNYCYMYCLSEDTIDVPKNFTTYNTTYFKLLPNEYQSTINSDAKIDGMNKTVGEYLNGDNIYSPIVTGTKNCVVRVRYDTWITDIHKYIKDTIDAYNKYSEAALKYYLFTNATKESTGYDEEAKVVCEGKISCTYNFIVDEKVEKGDSDATETRNYKTEEDLGKIVGEIYSDSGSYSELTEDPQEESTVCGTKYYLKYKYKYKQNTNFTMRYLVLSEGYDIYTTIDSKVTDAQNDINTKINNAQKTGSLSDFEDGIKTYGATICPESKTVCRLVSEEYMVIHYASLADDKKTLSKENDHNCDYDTYNDAASILNAKSKCSTYVVCGAEEQRTGASFDITCKAEGKPTGFTYVLDDEEGKKSKEDELLRTMNSTRSTLAKAIIAVNDAEDDLSTCDEYFKKYANNVLSDSGYENIVFSPTLDFYYTQTYLDDYGKSATSAIYVNFDRICTETEVNFDSSSDKIYTSSESGISNLETFGGFKCSSTDSTSINETSDLSLCNEETVSSYINSLLDSSTHTISRENLEGAQKTYSASTAIFIQGSFKKTCFWVPSNSENKYTLPATGLTLKSTSSSTRMTLHNTKLMTNYWTVFTGTYETHWNIQNLGSRFDEYLKNNSTTCLNESGTDDNWSPFTCQMEVKESLVKTGGCRSSSADCPSTTSETNYSTYYSFKVVDPSNLFPACEFTSTTPSATDKKNCYDNIHYAYNWLVEDSKGYYDIINEGISVMNTIQSTANSSTASTYSPSNLTYSFTLTSSDMQAIRNYNTEQESNKTNGSGGYEDNDLICKQSCDSSSEIEHVDLVDPDTPNLTAVLYKDSCRQCYSTFISNLASNKVEISSSNTYSSNHDIWGRTDSKTLVDIRNSNNW